MIFADSSVWIDYARKTPTLETERLDVLIADLEVVVGDLVMAEVLQGFTNERNFQITIATFNALQIVRVVDRKVAAEAARNFQALRRLGITIRGTIDTLIATPLHP